MLIYADSVKGITQLEDNKCTPVSPNGDFLNDYLKIDEIEIGESIVTIFNRWGDQVYETNNYLDEPWEGQHFRTGNELPNGTYYYFVRRLDQETDKNIFGNTKKVFDSGCIELRFF